MSEDVQRRILTAKIQASVNERAIAIFAICTFANKHFRIDLDMAAAVAASATVDDVLMQLAIEIECCGRCNADQMSDRDQLIKRTLGSSDVPRSP